MMMIEEQRIVGRLGSAADFPVDDFAVLARSGADLRLRRLGAGGVSLEFVGGGRVENAEKSSARLPVRTRQGSKLQRTTSIHCRNL